MKRSLIALTTLIILSLACNLGANAPAENQPVETATSSPVNNNAGEAILLFTIGMHIEPMGETAQGYNSGKGNYHEPAFFDKHVSDILALTQIF